MPCRIKVRDRFHQSKINAERILDECLAISGNCRSNDPNPAAAQAVNLDQLFTNHINRIPLIGLIVVV